MYYASSKWGIFITKINDEVEAEDEGEKIERVEIDFWKIIADEGIEGLIEKFKSSLRIGKRSL